VIRFSWRVPAALLAASYVAPASMIVRLPQPESVHIEPVPDHGPKLQYTIGEEIRVYPVQKDQPPPVGLQFVCIGLPAAMLFFVLVPGLQRLALRFRLLND
jgi:hypothetical protein